MNHQIKITPGKIYLITGGSGYLGAALTSYVVSQGGLVRAFSRDEGKLIELKDKLKKDNLISGITPNIFNTENAKVRNESLAALVMLGIARATAEKSIDVILKREGNDITVEQLIKLALR